MNDFEETSGLREYPLARRGMMMMTGLMSGFTLAVDRVVAQTITTDSKGSSPAKSRSRAKDGEIPGKGNARKGRIADRAGRERGNLRRARAHPRRVPPLRQGGLLRRSLPSITRASATCRKCPMCRTIVNNVVNKAPDAQVLARSRCRQHLGRLPARATSHRVAVTGFCRGGRQMADRARQPQAQGGCRMVRTARRTFDIRAKERARRAEKLKCAGARALWRADPGIVDTDNIHAAKRTAAAKKRSEIISLSGHAARLQRRLSPELSQGGSR